MTTLFVILVILASVILGLIVLVQNPKGGGLAGNIAGFSNQFMGVKQTTDVLEKGTWIFAGVIGVLCLVSTLFISGGSSSSNGASNKISTTPVQTAPATNPSGLGTNPNLQPQTNPTTTAQKTTK
ncbi:MAG: preprotein translocase subunit SecG [Bacteroidetes bacterium]|jgi:preprotein translocase subunit SecG|nr:MAG: preprotein translocase subunit SecG [Bacteroidota bacterium]